MDIKNNVYIRRKQKTFLINNSLKVKSTQSFQILYEASNKFQSQGNELESLKFLERTLFMMPSDEQCEELTKNFIERGNVLAMNLLQQENYITSFEYLKKAEQLCSKKAQGRENGYIENEKVRMQLLAITQNNYGCYYRKRGKLRKALKAFESALQIEKSLGTENNSNLAATMMNLCVIMSQLNQHNEALLYAQDALKILNNSQHFSADILPIAYHNLAVEYEFLKQFSTAKSCYLKSVEISKQVLGEKHLITKVLSESQTKAFQKMDQLEKSGQETLTSVHSVNLNKISLIVRNSQTKFLLDLNAVTLNKQPETSWKDLHSSPSDKVKLKKGNSYFEPKPPLEKASLYNRHYLGSKRNISTSSPVFISKKPQIFSSLPNSPNSSVVVRSIELLKRKDKHKESEDYNYFATVIQRVFRGFLVRRKLKQETVRKLSYQTCSDDFIRKFTPHWKPREKTAPSSVVCIPNGLAKSAAKQTDRTKGKSQLSRNSSASLTNNTRPLDVLQSMGKKLQKLSELLS